MNKRRTFIKNTALCSGALALNPWGSLGAKPAVNTPTSMPMISLAQWSLHRALENKIIKAEDFAAIAKNTYGISAVEYVNQFYTGFGSSEKYWNQLKTRAEDADVQSLLIMVDNEGQLGNPDNAERRKAVENHYKWVHAAKLLGCHSIRVNAFGEGERKSLKGALVDGLGQLASYGATEGINILIENHGLHTSDASFVVDIIQEVNNPYLGTLPDFGNWCLDTDWGSTQGGKCSNTYDPIKGLSQFLPYAKGVSAKSYAFNEEGDETSIPYPELLQLIKDSAYKGYIGIEYEGETGGEPAGIRATKVLIEKVWKDLK